MIHMPIKGYEDYLVTDTGKVYSLKSEKYLKSWDNGDGYLILDIGKRKNAKVHRLVAETFIDNPKNKKCVDHINRNRKDNRVENLRWVSLEENNQYTTVSEKRLRNCYKRCYEMKKKNMKPIIEEIEGEYIFYEGRCKVPFIDPRRISDHISKGETDFYHNGRHFIVPKEV